MILSRRHDTILSSSYCDFWSRNLVVLNNCAVRMLCLSRSPNLIVLNHCAVRMLRLSRSLTLAVMILRSANALSFLTAELCCPLIAMPSNGERFYTFKEKTWQINTGQIVQKSADKSKSNASLYWARSAAYDYNISPQLCSSSNWQKEYERQK